MNRKLVPAVLALGAAVCGGGEFEADAAAVAAPAALTAAAEAAPVVKESVGLLTEVAEIPKDTAEILCLPWGVTECVFSPLPGVSFMSGLRHVGTGIVAPFKLVGDVLTLPYDAATAVSRSAGSVAPLKAAGGG